MKHCFAVIAFLACLANADVYLHNPRGSNNRCDEKNNNANNNNRIFDSQNNAQGGYPITQSGQMEVFEGTVLPLKWATQHGCNTANEECTVIVQAMCANDLTDGTPQGNGGNTCTQTRPENQAQIRENDQFAMHESAEFYAKCKERERNPKLFTADQNLNGKDSRFTRQNPKGKRSGFECPTERDYFPTWIPNPFFDIAVLTSNTDRCGLYQAKSQNVDPKGECSNPRANDPARCAELGGTWNLAPLPLNISAPDCIRAQFSNQNRLGDIAAGNMSSYDWLVPQGLVPAGQDSTKCVLRVRYNITSADAPFNFTSADNNRLKKNPVVNLGNGVNMRFAVNTAQVARTFEDRSFVFNVRKRPADLAAATIHSVTVMGRRGNIAQIGPNSIEYEFAPRKLAAKPGDVINFQFLGSNFDPQNNDGEGKKGTSRSNLVPAAANAPDRYVGAELSTFSGLFTAEDLTALAMVGQNPAKCRKNNLGQDENANDACEFLNAAPDYFGRQVTVQNGQAGEFNFICSRNNNFSNRNQAFTLVRDPAAPGAVGSGPKITGTAEAVSVSGNGNGQAKKQNKQQQNQKDAKKNAKDAAKQDPKQQDPKKQDPKQQDPKQQDPKQQDPKQQDPKQQDPKQQDPKQQNPKQQDPKQENPKQDPKQAESKKQGVKQQETKKAGSKQQEVKAAAANDEVYKPRGYVRNRLFRRFRNVA